MACTPQERPCSLRFIIEDIWASSLPAAEKRWLLRHAVLLAFNGSAKAHQEPDYVSECSELGVVDAACQLAAGALGARKVPIGQLSSIMKESGEAGQELARRLSRASKARRLRAHPDPLLLRDIELFLHSRARSNTVGGVIQGIVDISETVTKNTGAATATQTLGKQTGTVEGLMRAPSIPWQELQLQSQFVQADACSGAVKVLAQGAGIEDELHTGDNNRVPMLKPQEPCRSRSASPKVGPLGIAVPPDGDHSIQARWPLPAGSLVEQPIVLSDADKAALARIARMDILASQLQAALKDPSASARDAEQALTQELSRLLAEIHSPQTTCSATAPVSCPTGSCGGTPPSRTAPCA